MTTADALEKPGLDEEAGNQRLNALVCENPAWLVGCLGRIVGDRRHTPTWRNYAVQHLARCVEQHASRTALDRIAMAADDPEPAVREVALFSLARLARDLGDEGIRGLALAAVDRAVAVAGPPLVRDAAIRAAGELQDRQRTAALIDLLSDARSPSQVRLAAVDVLGAWGEPAALPALRAVAVDAGRTALADGARQAIARIESGSRR